MCTVFRPALFYYCTGIYSSLGSDWSAEILITDVIKVSILLFVFRKFLSFAMSKTIV